MTTTLCQTIGSTWRLIAEALREGNDLSWKSAFKDPFLVAYAAIVSFIGAHTFIHPQYNFDLIPYSAAVAAIDLRTPEAIHEATYASVKAALPAARFRQLTGDGGYGQDLLDRPDHLVQQIPFYSNRPAYVLSLYALKRLGLAVPKASVLISSLSYFLLCALVWHWTKLRLKESILSFALATPLAIGPTSLLSGLSTPDPLSALLTLTALYLLFERNNLALALALATLGASLFLRTDNLVLCFLVSLMLIADGLKSRRRPTIAVLFFAACVGTVWLINHVFHFYGWKRLVYHALIKSLSNPAEANPELSAIAYVKLLISGAATIRYSYLTACLLFLALVAIAIRAAGREFFWNRSTQGMTLAVTSIAVHFLMFPTIEDRYFVAQYLALIILSAGWMLEAIGSEQTQQTRERAERRIALPSAAASLGEVAAGRSARRGPAAAPAK